jgi:selT/selW/selH-like putative selenoprotein
VESELVRGGGGIFNVTVDGTRIYSKHDTGKFPTEEEIVERLRSMKHA